MPQLSDVELGLAGGSFRVSRVWIRISVITLLIAFTLSLHYMILPVPHGVHLLHRRLCYLPIILGALWFGLRGGICTAGVISAAVIPLALSRGGPVWGNEDFVEIVFYLGIGFLSGLLVDRGHRERDKKQQLEKDLMESERLAAAGRTAAGIAHEVRTPLASIQGAIEILSEDYPREHPREIYFEILVQETRRLKRVMDDFLDLYRPVSLAPSSVEIAAFMRDCEVAVSEFARSRKVGISTECGGDPIATFDPERVRQVVTNLLRNAIQASSEGGEVALGARVESGRLRVEVSDRGHGIQPGEEEKIFEPFFTKQREGIGLGLSLARQVASAHGGTLRAENIEGGGARFTLELPSGGAGGGR